MRGASGDSLHGCSNRDAVNPEDMVALTIPIRHMEVVVDLSNTRPVEMRASFSIVPQARERMQFPCSASAQVPHEDHS